MSEQRASDLRCVASGPLSATSRYTLLIRGEYGPREITNLIRFLKLTREWLLEDAPHDAEMAVQPAGINASNGNPLDNETAPQPAPPAAVDACESGMEGRNAGSLQNTAAAASHTDDGGKPDSALQPEPK